MRDYIPNAALIYWNASHAPELLNRFRMANSKRISLNDIVDSVDIDTRNMSFSEARDTQAVLLADSLQRKYGEYRSEAYALASRVLAAKNSSDFGYLQMWNEVCKYNLSMSRNHMTNHSSLKADILSRLFHKFSEGGNQSVVGKNAAYVGYIFIKVYRGAQKRAEEYGLIPMNLNRESRKKVSN